MGLSFSDACDTSITANFVSGNFLATVFDRLGHEEADADHEVVLLLRERREVRHVVGVRIRRDDATFDPELRLGVVEPLVRQGVERAVVQTADVRDEADADLLARRRLRRRRRAAAAGRRIRRGVVVTARCCRQYESCKADREDRPRHPFPEHRRTSQCCRITFWTEWPTLAVEAIYRRARRSALSASSANAASSAVRVMSTSSPSPKPMRAPAMSYSRPIEVAKYGGSSEPRVTRTPAA